VFDVFGKGGIPLPREVTDALKHMNAMSADMEMVKSYLKELVAIQSRSEALLREFLFGAEERAAG
jgi:hypothetical protein